MLSHLIGYWFIGLPLGYWLCFSWGQGAVGLWTGLCVALILIGIVLLAVWRRRVLVLPARQSIPP
jgi:MATE family multidrug resistance protein